MGINIELKQIRDSSCLQHSKKRESRRRHKRVVQIDEDQAFFLRAKSYASRRHSSECENDGESCILLEDFPEIVWADDIICNGMENVFQVTSGSSSSGKCNQPVSCSRRNTFRKTGRRHMFRSLGVTEKLALLYNDDASNDHSQLKFKT